MKHVNSKSGYRKYLFQVLLKQDHKLSASIVIAITLCNILHYRITLYPNIAKLSFLNFIAVGTQEPLSGFKVIDLSKFEPLSLLNVIVLKTHKRHCVTPLHFEVTLPTSGYGHYSCGYVPQELLSNFNKKFWRCSLDSSQYFHEDIPSMSTGKSKNKVC